MMPAWLKAIIFLIQIIFDLYIIILLIRLLMQKFRANYYNPISQAVIKITNFMVLPLQRVLSGYRGFDLAIVVLLVLFSLLETCLLFWLRMSVFPHWLGLLVLGFTGLLNKLVNLYFYAILISALMSWIPDLRHSYLGEIVHLVAEPLLNHARRIIPSFGGFDFSPILALIVLQLIGILIVAPLLSFGMTLSF